MIHNHLSSLIKFSLTINFPSPAYFCENFTFVSPATFWSQCLALHSLPLCAVLWFDLPTGKGKEIGKEEAEKERKWLRYKYVEGENERERERQRE